MRWLLGHPHAHRELTSSRHVGASRRTGLADSLPWCSPAELEQKRARLRYLGWWSARGLVFAGATPWAGGLLERYQVGRLAGTGSLADASWAPRGRVARLARAKIAADPKAVSLVDSHSCPMAEPYYGV